MTHLEEIIERFQRAYQSLNDNVFDEAIRNLKELAKKDHMVIAVRPTPPGENYQPAYRQIREVFGPFTEDAAKEWAIKANSEYPLMYWVIISLSSPSDIHVLDEGFRDETRSCKGRVIEWRTISDDLTKIDPSDRIMETEARDRLLEPPRAQQDLNL